MNTEKRQSSPAPADTVVKPRRRFIRLPEVRETTGLGTTSIYQRMIAGTFPKQIPLGGRVVAWLESDINAWMDDKIKNRV